MKEPIYFCGDILFIKNVRFKDTGKIDLKIKGHPFILLKTVNRIGQIMYLLKVSRSEKIIKNEDKFYYIKPSSKGLKYGGYVDLRYIYKIKATNLPEYNKKITQEQFNDIAEKLKKIHKKQTRNKELLIIK